MHLETSDVFKNPKPEENNIFDSASDNKLWQPLIVIGNRKSGNNDGAAILAAFRSQLNPAQVYSIMCNKLLWWPPYF